MLTPDIFDILHIQPVDSGDEIQLTNGINTQAANDAVESETFSGHRFDCGTAEGYLDAIMHVADRRRR